MTLSTLAILLGVVYCIPQVYALINPEGYTRALRGFARSEAWGFALMTVGAAWFLYNLNRETIADFAAYKRLMLAGFGGLAVLTCIYVRDYLAVRGLAVSLLMLAWYTHSQTRWAESNWRLVLVVWAYLWVAGSMWVTVAPYRLRDYFHLITASEHRIRFGAGVRLAFGLFVAILGLTAFRA
jgi:hypothetical protein